MEVGGSERRGRFSRRMPPVAVSRLLVSKRNTEGLQEPSLSGKVRP